MKLLTCKWWMDYWLTFVVMVPIWWWLAWQCHDTWKSWPLLWDLPYIKNYVYSSILWNRLNNIWCMHVLSIPSALCCSCISKDITLALVLKEKVYGQGQKTIKTHQGRDNHFDNRLFVLIRASSSLPNNSLWIKLMYKAS